MLILISIVDLQNAHLGYGWKKDMDKALDLAKELKVGGEDGVTE